MPMAALPKPPQTKFMLVDNTAKTVEAIKQFQGRASVQIRTSTNDPIEVIVSYKYDKEERSIVELFAGDLIVEYVEVVFVFRQWGEYNLSGGTIEQYPLDASERASFREEMRRNDRAARG